MAQIQTTHVAQFNALEMTPSALVGVEVRRVAGQTLQMNIAGRTVGEKGFDLLTAVNRRAIPDHQQLAIDLMAQMLQEVNTLGAIQRRIARQREQLALQGNAAYHRQMITSLKDAQNRRVSARRIGAHDRRQQVEARFVNKHKGESYRLKEKRRAGLLGQPKPSPTDEEHDVQEGPITD